ncbi:hypothetical protein [Winogradskyella algicola]|uniref:hypothetical protein n=1 Tax=Winogradskyella algicola TaxID=2575815 RepID=UPI00110892D9|nr:hypothetical protein [Winogradskyella algicola]
MNTAEDKIKTTALKVMNDIDWGFDTSKDIECYFESFDEQVEQLKSLKNHEKYEEILASIFPIWKVFFEFESDTEIDNNVMILKINDETSEPFQIRHKQARFDILKNDEGKYYTKLAWSQ